MHGLVRLLTEGKFICHLKSFLRRQEKVKVEGGSLSVWSAVLAATLYDFQQPALVIISSSEKLSSFIADLETLLQQSGRVFPFPTHSTLLSSDSELNITRDRITAIDSAHNKRNFIIVATPMSLCQPTLPTSIYEQCALTVHVGDIFDRDELVSNLISGGYERVFQVEASGQFSVRGDIVDFFSPAHDFPIRLEFFGDEVESIRPFEVESQRSSEKWQQCSILPAREFIVKNDETVKTIKRIYDALESEQIRLNETGKPQQAYLLRSKVEHDAERLAQSHYFDGCEWYFPFAYEPLPTLIDHLPPNTIIFWLEPHELDVYGADVNKRWEKVWTELVETGDLLPPPHPLFLMWDADRKESEQLNVAVNEKAQDMPTVNSLLRPFPSVVFTAERIKENQNNMTLKVLTLNSSRVETFMNNSTRFLSRIGDWMQKNYFILIATGYPERATDWLKGSVRLDINQEVPVVKLDINDSPIADTIGIVPSPLTAGFILPDERLVVVTDAELFNAPYKPRKKRWRGTAPVKSPSDLHEGDYVVHIHHGIGIYRGIVRKEILGKESDYLFIEYAEGERLLVPVHQIDRVRRYVAIDGSEPALYSLSSNNRWLKLRQKAKENADLVAKELLEIYARRQIAEGFVFSSDHPWQAEMESAFPFIETDDQLRAIDEVKFDMEQAKPMNRLVCGDVGFGKTEIAIRSAFKAVMDGKQVAVLVPTTVLALQHYQTFTQRLKPYPVRIEMLSRLQMKKQQTEIVKGIRTGLVDIVIGTHRLLSDDIRFKDLGLFIIDEEQRFGVRQKERLKDLQVGVDVLILTATPIPRTLNMALSSILDMSLVNTPPEGRRPIVTYLSVYDLELVRFAILRELQRGGQVFYVFNRVQGIEHVAQKVQNLIPEAKVVIAHGQLPEDELERVMLEFSGGKWDVMVCTTIIENGLDVPNANTLIVEHCERFGLAQLYQLRGRIGRSDRQAYAYFFHEHPKRLTESARRRLEAIREFSDLGSGFRLALKDLEIRGAGNFLGVEQHGSINEVGLDVYLDMVNEAIHKLQGKPLPKPLQLPEVDLPVKAFIPESYVEDLEQRIYLYRKMSSVKTEEDIVAIASELKDRYGDPPKTLQNILSVLKLRVMAFNANILNIVYDRRNVTVKCKFNLNLTDTAIVKLYNLLRETQPPHILHCIRYERDRFFIDWTELSSNQLLQLLESLLAVLPQFLPQR